MIIRKDDVGSNYFHEVARSGSVAVLRRVEPFAKEIHKSVLRTVDFRGYQCVHNAAQELEGTVSVMMIEYLIRLGAKAKGAMILCCIRLSTEKTTILPSGSVSSQKSS